MRREDFTVDVRGVDWIGDDSEPEQPTLRVDYDGDGDELRVQLADPEGTPLDDERADVSFRLLSALGDGDVAGVVGITDRLTGDFVLEANATADEILQFVRAARRYGEVGDAEDGQYIVSIRAGDAELATYEKRTLLVYNDDGDLLRDRSLIPGGVEL